MGLTAKELAQAVRDERMEFDDALMELLMQNQPDQPDLGFFMTLKVAIGYAKLDRWDKQLAISDDDSLSVRDIIERFDLGPFLEIDANED